MPEPDDNASPVAALAWNSSSPEVVKQPPLTAPPDDVGKVYWTVEGRAFFSPASWFDAAPTAKVTLICFDEDPNLSPVRYEYPQSGSTGRVDVEFLPAAGDQLAQYMCVLQDVRKLNSSNSNNFHIANVFPVITLTGQHMNETFTFETPGYVLDE